MQRKQHGRFKAVAVLGWHGADDAVCLGEEAKAAGFGSGIFDQTTPGFGVRRRPAGGAGGKQAGSDLLGGYDRDFCHFFRVDRSIQWEIEARQVEGVEIVVAQANYVRAGRLNLAQCFGRLRGRLQAGLAADQAGRKANGEAVAVLANVEQVVAGRQ